MMRYICQNCKSIVDGEELKTRSELIGEYWGSPAYESFSVCPYCGDDELEEAHECACCGEEFGEDDMVGGVCKNCLHSLDNDWKFWYNKCNKHNVTDEVTLNAFLLSQFSASDIEEILVRELTNAEKIQPGVASCKGFVEEDESWSADMIKEGEDSENI